jgi:hypothetical protein
MIMPRQIIRLGDLHRLHGRITIRIKSFTLDFNAEFLLMVVPYGKIKTHVIRTPCKKQPKPMIKNGLRATPLC